MDKTNNKNFKKRIVEPRINRELENYNSIRLIYKDEKDDNSINKVVDINEAFSISKKFSLDLVEVNGNTNPPVVLLCDYSKYLFEMKKNIKNKNKNAVVCKEIQLSVNIGQHDLEIKVDKARKFLKEGNKVKVVLTIRGRELGRRELSKECFRKFISMISDESLFESEPRDEGNKVIAILKRK